MGVRTLVGVADGTDPAAAMYDSGSGRMIGPLFQGDTAFDQIEAFQGWLRTMRYVRLAAEIGLGSADLPHPAFDGTDPRHWPPSGLDKLGAYWRQENLDDETGELPGKEDA